MERKHSLEQINKWKNDVIAVLLLGIFAFFINRGIEIKGLMDDLYLWSCYGEQSFMEFNFPSRKHQIPLFVLPDGLAGTGLCRKSCDLVCANQYCAQYPGSRFRLLVWNQIGKVPVYRISGRHFVSVVPYVLLSDQPGIRPYGDGGHDYGAGNLNLSVSVSK